jgi:hypothetical protein
MNNKIATDVVKISIILAVSSSNKKVCPMCGATVDGNPDFCINCGGRLKYS